MQVPRRDVRVENDGAQDGLSPGLVRRSVRAVLDGEGTGPAEICVTFVSPERIRDLNRRSFQRETPTDVIAFTLPHPGVLVGDMYVCPAVARATARESGVSDEEELLRLVVHGTLHVMGYDHPEGAERTLSLMWRVQEHYVRQLTPQAT